MSVSTILGKVGHTGHADGYIGTATFNNVQYINFDNDDNLYVSDTANRIIRRITTSDNINYSVLTIAGIVGETGGVNGDGLSSRFNRAFGVACDNIGDIFVADLANFNIRKIIYDGINNKVSTIAGNNTESIHVDGDGPSARFVTPFCITSDSNNNLYVTDDIVIRKITTTDNISYNVSTIAGKTSESGGRDDEDGLNATFDDPYGIACDNSGNIFVTEGKKNTIRKITTTDNINYSVTTIAGIYGVAGHDDGDGLYATFNTPYSIACDNNGNIYVSDSNNSTIRKITTTDNINYSVTTIAGTHGVNGHANGDALSSTFYHPTGIACDSSGNLYISDNNNATIRKIVFEQTTTSTTSTTTTTEPTITTTTTESIITTTTTEPIITTTTTEPIITTTTTEPIITTTTTEPIITTTTTEPIITTTTTEPIITTTTTEPIIITSTSTTSTTQPTSTTTTIPQGNTGDICFVKGTLVETNQGYIPIQDLIPGKHRIFKDYIIAITETIHTDSHLVKVSAYAFGSYPTKDTYVSKNHKINGVFSFEKAQDYVNGTTITLVPYSGEPLYNVLCERSTFMKVHGMMVETLDPGCKIALQHKSKRYPDRYNFMKR